MLEAARRKGQTAIGYRLLAEASAPEQAFGVHLNPDKSAMVTLAADDRIIVLAENSKRRLDYQNPGALADADPLAAAVCSQRRH